MIRARVVLALTSLLVVGVLPAPCQQTTPAKKNGDVRVFFKDTGLAKSGLGTPSGARTFDLQAPGQRDSLRATLRRERELWRAGGVRDYRFLLRVECFCPRMRGWLLMEVRDGRRVQVWDRTGGAAARSDWNTFSIEEMFDNLNRSADVDRSVKIAFDPHRHFPGYVHAVGVSGPDVWVTIEARGLRPL